MNNNRKQKKTNDVNDSMQEWKKGLRRRPKEHRISYDPFQDPNRTMNSGRLSPVIKPRESLIGTNRRSSSYTQPRTRSVGSLNPLDQSFGHSNKTLKRHRNSFNGAVPRIEPLKFGYGYEGTSTKYGTNLSNRNGSGQGQVLNPTLRSSRATAPIPRQPPKRPPRIDSFLNNTQSNTGLISFTNRRSSTPLAGKLKRRNSVDFSNLRRGGFQRREHTHRVAMYDSAGPGNMVPVPPPTKQTSVVNILPDEAMDFIQGDQQVLIPTPSKQVNLVGYQNRVEVLTPMRIRENYNQQILIPTQPVNLETQNTIEVLTPVMSPERQVVVLPEVAKPTNILIERQTPVFEMKKTLVKVPPQPQVLIPVQHIVGPPRVSRTSSPESPRTIVTVHEPMQPAVPIYLNGVDVKEYQLLKISHDNLTAHAKHLAGQLKNSQRANKDYRLNEQKHTQEIQNISLRYQRLIEDLERKIDKMKRSGNVGGTDLMRENAELKRKLMMMENANHQLNLHTSTLDVDKGRLSQEMKLLNEQINTIKRENMKLTSKIKQGLDEKERLNNIVQTLRSELRVIKEVEKRTQGNQNDYKIMITKYEKTISQLQTKIDGLQKLQEANTSSNKSIDPLLKQVSYLSEENNKLRKAMTDFQLLKNQNDSLKAEIQKVNQTWAERVKKSVTELKNKLETEYKKSIQILETKYKKDNDDDTKYSERMELENERLRKELERVLTEQALENRKSGEYQKELMTYKETVTTLKQKISKMDLDEIDKIDKLNQKNIQEFEKEKYTLQAEIVYLRQKVIELEKEAADWRKQVANLENDLHFLTEINVKSHEITKEEFRKKLETLNYDKDKFSQRENQVENLLEEITKLKKEKRELESLNFRKQGNIEGLEAANLRQEENIDNLKRDSQNNMIEITREANNKIMELEKQIADLHDQVELKDIELERASNIIREKDQKFNALDLSGMMRKSEHQEELGENTNRVKDLEDQVRNLKKNLRMNKSDARKELEEKDDNINQLLNELQQISKVIEDLENKNHNIEEELMKNGKELKERENDIKDLAELVGDKDGQIDALNRELKFYKKNTSRFGKSTFGDNKAFEAPQNMTNPAKNKNVHEYQRSNEPETISRLEKSNINSNRNMDSPSYHSEANLPNSSGAFNFLPGADPSIAGSNYNGNNNGNPYMSNVGDNNNNIFNSYGDQNSTPEVRDREPHEDDVNYVLEPAPHQILSSQSNYGETPAKNIFIQDEPGSDQRGRFETVVPNRITTHDNTARNTIQPPHFNGQNSEIQRIKDELDKLKNENDDLKKAQRNQQELINGLNQNQPVQNNNFFNESTPSLGGHQPANADPNNRHPTSDERRINFSKKPSPTFMDQDNQGPQPNDNVSNIDIQPVQPHLQTPEGYEPSTREGYTQPMSVIKGGYPQNRLNSRIQQLDLDTIPQEEQGTQTSNRQEPVQAIPYNQNQYPHPPYQIIVPTPAPVVTQTFIPIPMQQQQQQQQQPQQPVQAAQSPLSGGLNYTPSPGFGSVEGPQVLTNYPSFKSASKIIDDFPPIKEADLEKIKPKKIKINRRDSLQPGETRETRKTYTNVKVDDNYDEEVDTGNSRRYNFDNRSMIDNANNTNNIDDYNYDNSIGSLGGHRDPYGGIGDRFNHRNMDIGPSPLDPNFDKTPSQRSIKSNITLDDQEQYKLDKKLNSYFKNIDDYLNHGKPSVDVDPPRLSNSSYRDKIARDRLYNQDRSPEGYKNLMKEKEGEKAGPGYNLNNYTSHNPHGPRLSSDYPGNPNRAFYSNRDYGINPPAFQNNTPGYTNPVKQPSPYNLRSTRETQGMPLNARLMTSQPRDSPSRLFNNRRPNPHNNSNFTRLSDNDAVNHIKTLEGITNDLENEIENFKGCLQGMEEEDQQDPGLEQRVKRMEKDLDAFKRELMATSRSQKSGANDTKDLRDKVKKL